LTQLFLTTELLFAFAAAFFWYVFAERYTGRQRHYAPRVIAASYFILVLILGLTNESHHLVWSHINTQVDSISLTADIGKSIGHYLFTLSSYGFYFTGIYYILSLINSARHIKGIAFVLLSPLSLVGVNLVPYFFEIPLSHVTTLTSLGATGCLIFAALAIERRLLDIQPIARQKVLAELVDPLLVLDQNKKIVDYNDAFIDLFGTPTNSNEFDDEYPLLSNQIKFENETKTESNINLPEKDAIYTAKTISVTMADEITGYTILLRDVTELKNSVAEVERHNRHLQDFSDSAAHELRNPLALIKGYSESIQEETKKDKINGEEIRSHLSTIYDSTRRMNSILDDFLKTIQSAQSIEETYDIQFKKAVDTASKKIEVSGLTVHTPVNGIIIADPQRLHLLLKTILRFLSNTSNEDSEITTELRQNGFVIQTKRTNLNENLGNSLLQYGYTSKHDGQGLGLSIAKTLAETHYWEIELETKEDRVRIMVTGAESELECNLEDGVMDAKGVDIQQKMST
jgi:signal transduction histidine kinase